MAHTVDLSSLAYAVVNRSGGYPISAHQHPDAAVRFIKSNAYPEDWKVVDVVTGEEV